MRHWLIKSEPHAYSIEDLRRDGRISWDGVRNYQARNNLRAMQVGDLALFYHSNAEPSGAAGVARVSRVAYPDPTQFDKRDVHYDSKSKREKPTWDAVEVAFARAFPRLVPLAELKADAKLRSMLLVSGKASRLSVQPVEKRHFDQVCKLGEVP